jgi:hypothetical protein
VVCEGVLSELGVTRCNVCLGWDMHLLGNMYHCRNCSQVDLHFCRKCNQGVCAERGTKCVELAPCFIRVSDRCLRWYDLVKK